MIVLHSLTSKSNSSDCNERLEDFLLKAILHFLNDRSFLQLDKYYWFSDNQNFDNSRNWFTIFSNVRLCAN